MKDYRKTLIPPSLPIIETVAVINASAEQIAIVVDDDQVLLGTVTDGDVRRGLLAGRQLTEPVATVMNRSPITADKGQKRHTLMSIMRQHSIAQMPLLDEGRRVVGLETLSYLLKQEHLDNWVVLMAGGLGTRLRPLTHTVPKPLLAVGGKPIIEWTIGSLSQQGFERFILCLNYKAAIFRACLGDGERLGAQLEYVEEKEQLGTAGALSLLPERPTAPFVVINGDVLTTGNMRQLLDFHDRTAADATVCVSQYTIQIPYGVARVDGETLLDMQEKPSQTFLVNAGIYALSPHVLDLLPPGQRLDMPDLLKLLQERGMKVAAFPLHEYWRDIGRPEDLTGAEQDLLGLTF